MYVLVFPTLRVADFCYRYSSVDMIMCIFLFLEWPYSVSPRRASSLYPLRVHGYLYYVVTNHTGNK